MGKCAHHRRGRTRSTRLQSNLYIYTQQSGYQRQQTRGAKSNFKTPNSGQRKVWYRTLTIHSTPVSHSVSHNNCHTNSPPKKAIHTKVQRMGDTRSKTRRRTTKPERIMHLSRHNRSRGGLVRLLQLPTAGHLGKQKCKHKQWRGEWRGVLSRRNGGDKKEEGKKRNRGIEPMDALFGLQSRIGDKS